MRTIVTFHPRALINRPSNKSLAWKDLLLLMEDES
jgi:DNA polymerase